MVKNTILLLQFKIFFNLISFKSISNIFTYFSDLYYFLRKKNFIRFNMDQSVKIFNGDLER